MALKDGITVLGAGSSHTLLMRNAPPADADATTRKPYKFFSEFGVSSVRISELAIGSWPAVNGLEDLDVGIGFKNASNFRVDHCSFQYTGNSGVTTSAATTGVVDRCTFQDIFEAPIENFGYSVSVYGEKVHKGQTFGSKQATFIEDNHLDGCRHAEASNSGARYVFRYNQRSGNEFSHAVDTHGAEYPPTPKPSCSPCYEADPNNPGTEWAEI